ncbi:RNA polymerase sigma factor [Sphingobium cloacae]|uniref:RNA polymerase sigma70 n=1 Tax=Sphingobium cloacae TaxID=120107 RepID=A0A1E1F498_9SPHN|nr:RNA polymerase sigma factor [Sphingobium cloacae]BAV65348.1 RNA polymerase sigma70 [Sphingobium cloacae]
MAGKALKRLYLAHGRALQDYLTHKLRDPAAAADLAHDAFVRIAERGNAAALSNDRSYLFRTAHNLAVDHIRRVERRRTDPTDDERLAEIHDDAPPLDEAVAARQMLARLHDVVADLPDRTRRIFVLAKVEGLTYAEVADQLGISESSVQKHLSIALAHIMHRMKPQ